MTRESLYDKLAELKSDYARIQEDMDKLEFVGGRVASAEEQLVRLEGEIAIVNDELDLFDERK